MKLLKYIILGVFFGFILTKSEVVSWYRIQEMFRFQDFHMYGVIGSAVVLGAIIIQFIKRTKMKSTEGLAITFNPKNNSFWRYILGGTIFGLGWALAGACPGPTFVLAGYGYYSFFVVILAGIFGTYVYGVLRDKLPH